MRRPLPIALALCVPVAAASLALPFEPLFDPWAWLVWGREIAQGELDTAAGPSWKPLPALVAALLAPSGDAAPELWLLLARAGGLAVPVLAWALAARLAGGRPRARVLAGALAAAGTLLLHDAFTAPVRQLAGGLSEPLLTALVLGAVLAALERRPGLALPLAGAACLIRPEAWPFAGLYAWHLARRGEVSPVAIAAGAALVPLLWLAPDLLGAGNPLEGAGRAREATGSPPVEALEVVGRAALAPLLALWLGAALLVAGERRGPGGGRAASVLAAGALAWIALVAVMAAGGYAGLPRFMAPASAMVCALGGAGLARHVPLRAAPAALAVSLALLADGAWRAADLPHELDRAREEARATRELRALADRAPAELRSCRPVAVSDFLAQTALAWELELRLGEVRTAASYPREGVLLVGRRAAPGLRTLARLEGEPIAAAGEWEAYRTGPCPAGEPG